MTSRDQALQNWAGGTFKLIKLIGINSRFALFDKKAQEQKWLKNSAILKKIVKKRSNFSPVLNPETS